MPNDRFMLPLTGDSDIQRSFVSRAGQKLEAALQTFPLLQVTGKIAADLGCNVGGFTDCLLQRGAAKVYAVDTAYGVLAWTLRKDPRVVVRERSNALHVSLPEKVDILAIDVGWTRQNKILPYARTLLKLDAGDILTLIKPHYESEQAKKQHGVLQESESIAVLEGVPDQIAALHFSIEGVIKSPIVGQKGNTEFVAWLKPLT